MHNIVKTIVHHKLGEVADAILTEKGIVVVESSLPSIPFIIQKIPEFKSYEREVKIRKPWQKKKKGN